MANQILRASCAAAREKKDKGNGEVLVGYTYNGQKDAEFFFDSLKGCEDFVQFWAQQHDKYR
jgi:hypothetical protein